MKTEEEQQKRRGITLVTSVSLPKDFKRYMRQYGISPSEAIRRGVAIILFEKGLPQYQSETNKIRYKKLQEILQEEKMSNLVEKIEEVQRLLDDIKLALKKDNLIEEEK